MEIVTGRERRRSWSEEDKLEILQEAATSGLSVAEVARRPRGPARRDLIRQRRSAFVVGKAFAKLERAPTVVDAASGFIEESSL
jgi:transposase